MAVTRSMAKNGIVVTSNMAAQEKRFLAPKKCVTPPVRKTIKKGDQNALNERPQRSRVNYFRYENVRKLGEEKKNFVLNKFFLGLIAEIAAANLEAFMKRESQRIATATTVSVHEDDDLGSALASDFVNCGDTHATSVPCSVYVAVVNSAGRRTGSSSK